MTGPCSLTRDPYPLPLPVTLTLDPCSWPLLLTRDPYPWPLPLTCVLATPNLGRAFSQQEVSHRFMFTHKTYCLFNCWLYGIGIRFSPHNLKRKARCGSDLLEYVQVYNKIMQKLQKRKVRKHLKVLPRKVFQNRQACHEIQSGPFSIFAQIKSLFHQSKTWIYSKKWCLQLLSKRKQVVSSDIFCIET